MSLIVHILHKTKEKETRNAMFPLDGCKNQLGKIMWCVEALGSVHGLITVRDLFEALKSPELSKRPFQSYGKYRTVLVNRFNGPLLNFSINSTQSPPQPFDYICHNDTKDKSGRTHTAGEMIALAKQHAGKTTIVLDDSDSVDDSGEPAAAEEAADVDVHVDVAAVAAHRDAIFTACFLPQSIHPRKLPDDDVSQALHRTVSDRLDKVSLAAHNASSAIRQLIQETALAMQATHLDAGRTAESAEHESHALVCEAQTAWYCLHHGMVGQFKAL
jgi:hypothetical protein